MRVRGVIGTLGACLGATALLPAAAGAAGIAVTTTADEFNAGADCSLREAVRAANANADFGGCVGTGAFGSDTIVLPAFGSGDGDVVIRLSRAGAGEDANVTGDLDIAGPLTISGSPGPNEILIDGGELDRVFHVSSADPVSITDVEVANGSSPTDGGGILQAGAGALTLENVTVSGSRATNDGGGLASYSSATLINSTVANNSANGSGGGIYAPGGSSVSLENATIGGNAADADASGAGDGGGFRASGTFNATNSVIGDNRDDSPAAGDKVADCASGPSFFPRYTLIETFAAANCLVGFNPGTNIVNVDAGLGLLGSNGGNARTFAMKPESPALDAGTGTGIDLCEPADGRGVPRTLNGACDLGAVEYVECGGLRVSVVGTAAADLLVGGKTGRGMLGFGGNDRMSGRGGADTLCGGAGKDRLKGGKGRDKLKGGTGRDLCSGGKGRDKGPGCERKRKIP